MKMKSPCNLRREREQKTKKESHLCRDRDRRSIGPRRTKDDSGSYRRRKRGKGRSYLDHHVKRKGTVKEMMVIHFKILMRMQQVLS